MSEASVVASQHRQQAARNRAPSADAKPPSSPFSSLLDSETPAAPRDRTDAQPLPPKRAAATSDNTIRPDRTRPARNDERTETDAPRPGPAEAQPKPTPDAKEAEGGETTAKTGKAQQIGRAHV